MDALGFLEVKGFVTAITAADAMLKSAKVTLLPKHEIRPGIITLIVSGDLAACRAAVSAGVVVANQVGAVLAHNVIGRLDDDPTLNQLILLGQLCTQKLDRPKTIQELVVKFSAEKSVNLSEQNPNNNLDPVLVFLGTSSKGKTLNQILQAFTSYKLKFIQTKLDQLIALGLIQKRGTRYLLLKKG
jgi:ethanolamine utilization protein EutK